MTIIEKCLLENDEWTIICESPLELRHGDGSIATGRAAEIIIDWLNSWQIVLKAIENE